MDATTATKILTVLLQTAPPTTAITPFDRKVYTLLLQIPPGTFTTYGVLASILKSSPRAVGNSCRRNPFAPKVPCHRVVATGGGLGGFKGEHLRKIEKKMKIKKIRTRDGSTRDGLTRLGAGASGRGRGGGSVEEEGEEEDNENRNVVNTAILQETQKSLLTINEKRALLRKEGVKFDFKGDKVLGTPYMGFSSQSSC